MSLKNTLPKNYTLQLPNALATLEISQHRSARIVAASRNQHEIAAGVEQIIDAYDCTTPEAVDMLSRYLSAHMAFAQACTIGEAFYVDAATCRYLDALFPTYAQLEVDAQTLSNTVSTPKHGVCIFANAPSEDIYAIFWLTKPTVKMDTVKMDIDEDDTDDVSTNPTDTDTATTDTATPMSMHVGIAHLEEDASGITLIPNIELLRFDLDENPTLNTNPLLSLITALAARIHAGDIVTTPEENGVRVKDLEGVEFPLVLRLCSL